MGNVVDDYFSLREENKLLKEQISIMRKELNTNRNRLKYILDPHIAVVMHGLEEIKKSLES
tara:strand:+ start:141 stop:323 length:183 start_codon:yes stop_codon:yes gene_type:complete